jgi:uncharacterized membrane protein YphA (DoxX/SURF4 family)
LNKQFKKVLNNSWFELVCRWILGITFIYASYHKILVPAEFAKIIYGYDLFPGNLINLIAIVLPFVELVCGIALILGVFSRSATLIVSAMLVGFIIILSINLIRGHEFDCGCFSSVETRFAGSVEVTILRDIIYLILGLQVFWFKRPRKACIPIRK